MDDTSHLAEISKRLGEPIFTECPVVDQHMRQMRAVRMSGKRPDDIVYMGPEDLLFRQGRVWTYRPLPRRVKPGVVKHCYGNSLQLAKRRPDEFAYVEGIAYSGTIPCSHAWCVTPEGYVVDRTWDPINGHWDEDSPREYVGIAFNLSVAKRCLTRPNNTCLEDWDRGFPIFYGRETREQFMHPWFL